MKGKHLHTLAKALILRYPGKFTKDFAANKTALHELNLLKSGEEFNKLAGELAILEKRAGGAVVAAPQAA